MRNVPISWLPLIDSKYFGNNASARKVNVVNIKYLSPNNPFSKFKKNEVSSPEGINSSRNSAILNETITSRKAVPTDNAISFREISFHSQKLSASVFPSSLIPPLSTFSTCGAVKRLLKKLMAGIIIRTMK
jgi:hypothetical protein